MIAVGTVAARSAKDPTQMYRDGENVGRLVPGQIGKYRADTWSVDCEGSAFVTRGRSPRDRMRINVHHWDGVVDGYALFKSASRWVIYRFDLSPADRCRRCGTEERHALGRSAPNRGRLDLRVRIHNRTRRTTSGGSSLNRQLPRRLMRTYRFTSSLKLLSPAPRRSARATAASATSESVGWRSWMNRSSHLRAARS